MAQRIRSEYKITATPLRVTHWPKTCANRIVYDGVSPGVSLNGSSRFMIDTVIPRFRARQKAGERFFNDMYREEVTVSDVGSGAAFTTVADYCPGVKAWTRVDGAYVAMLTPRAPANNAGHYLPLQSTAVDPSEIERVKRLVSTEVLAKRGTGDSELWESMAEYRQTIEMLNNPVSRLKELSLRLLHSAENRQGSFSRQLMKEVSGGYLMYRYGVSPLMKDIKTILSSLHKEGGEKEVTSRSKEQLFATRSYAGQTVLDSTESNWQCQVNDAVTIRGMSLDRGYVSFANNLGFNAKGFALLPLQLTSYSFVADWFTNLSSYVGATIPAFGWQQLGSCLVVTRATSTSYGISYVVNRAPGSQVINPVPTGSSSIIKLSTTRGILMPGSFDVKSDFKFDKATRVADALALIASRFVRVSGLLGFVPNNSAFHDRRAYHAWEQTFFK